MWIQLFIACLAALLLLYVPGYLFFRGLRFPAITSLCVAPLAGMALYTLVPVAYYVLGVPCNWCMVALPMVVLGVATLAVARMRGGQDSELVSLPSLDDIGMRGLRLGFDTVVAPSYIFVALVVCLIVFVGSLPHPDAFYSRFDNQTHLNLVQAFLDSGKWSTLHTSVYLA